MFNFWTRFIDKIAGGAAPDAEKKAELRKKIWIWRYRVSLVLSFTWLILGIHPEIVSLLNGVPESGELQTLQVSIIRVYENDPHLLVERADGSKQYMEFPVRITSKVKGGQRFNGLTKSEKTKLAGCNALVYGVPLKGTFTDRFRVWALDCPTKNVYLNFEKCVKYFITVENSTAFAIISIVINFIFTAFILVVFLREKRGNL